MIRRTARLTMTIRCSVCGLPFESEWKQRRHCDACKVANDRRLRRRRSRNYIADGVRDAVLERDGGRCQLCGVKLYTKDRRGATYEECCRAFEIDHKVPLNNGGTSDMANLQAACRRCNRSKGVK